MRLCYYGEFDPYSGGLAQVAADLPVAVRELKLLLLLNDIVKVAPGVLLEHALALPVFETLAPFVRAGRLTTSCDASVTDLHAYLESRMLRFMKERRRDPRGSRGRAARLSIGDARRLREIAEIRDRWFALLPRKPLLTRDVSGQVNEFANRVVRYCEIAAPTSHAATMMLQFITRDLPERGGRPDRDVLWARLASLRGEVPLREITRLALTIQAAYLEMGAVIHEPQAGGATTRLYPGRIAELIATHATAAHRPCLPPLDWRGRFEHAAPRFRALGLDLAELLALPAQELCDLSSSEEWLAIRGLLVGATVDSAENVVAPNLADRLRLSRAAALAEPHAPIALAAAFLPAPWQLSAGAILVPAVTPSGTPATREVVLDLGALRLQSSVPPAHVPLSRADIYFITSVALAGDAGLHLDDVKQLLVELDRLPLLDWMAQRDASPVADTAHRNRADVQKSRTNALMAPLDLQIAPDALGRWRLVSLGPTVRLRISGALWEPRDQAASEPLAESLSPQLRRLWSALAEAAPDHLTVHALARALDKQHEDDGLKQTADAIGKLNELLVRRGAALRISHPVRGIYRLASPNSELR